MGLAHCTHRTFYSLSSLALSMSVSLVTLTQWTLASVIIRPYLISKYLPFGCLTLICFIQKTSHVITFFVSGSHVWMLSDYLSGRYPMNIILISQPPDLSSWSSVMTPQLHQVLNWWTTADLSWINEHLKPQFYLSKLQLWGHLVLLHILSQLSIHLKNHQAHMWPPSLLLLSWQCIAEDSSARFLYCRISCDLNSKSMDCKGFWSTLAVVSSAFILHHLLMSSNLNHWDIAQV